ncbi:hypothetical protein [Leifsonia shinshuensis]
MTRTLTPDWQARLIAATAHKKVGEEGWYRTIAAAVEAAPSQVAVADALHTSQAQVSRWAAKGRQIAAVRGQKIDSPYEAAVRYSVGELTRDQIIEILSTWDYRRWDNRTAGEHDDLLNTVAGSFDELTAAHADGLLEDDTYDAIADALEERAAVRTA